VLYAAREYVSMRRNADGFLEHSREVMKAQICDSRQLAQAQFAA
jgi:hypothetical protein